MRERVLFLWVASLAGAFLGGYFLTENVPRYPSLASASRVSPDFVNEIRHPTLAFLPSSRQPSLTVHDSSPGDASQSESIRLARQAAFQQQLMQALENAPECGGIGYISGNGRASEADFYLRVDIYGHTTGEQPAIWGWMLYDRRASQDLVGMGSANLPEIAARDICRNLWRQASPDHFAHPGIKSE